LSVSNYFLLQIGKEKVSVFHLVAKDSIEEDNGATVEEGCYEQYNCWPDNSKMFSMGNRSIPDITFRSEQENQTTEDSQQSRHTWTPLSSVTAKTSLTVEESVRNLNFEIMRRHPICVLNDICPILSSLLVSALDSNEPLAKT
jgi:hypothetical protein